MRTVEVENRFVSTHDLDVANMPILTMDDLKNQDHLFYRLVSFLVPKPNRRRQKKTKNDCVAALKLDESESREITAYLQASGSVCWSGGP